MSLLHDIIKIEFVNMGYLKDIPYHLISDNEMFEAFRRQDVDPLKQGMFADYYPCPVEKREDNPELYDSYMNLKDCINGTISNYKEGKIDEIPDWIYSYMLARPIGPMSSEADIGYLYDLLGEESHQGAYLFTPEIAELCYATSENWLSRNPSRYNGRVPTVFGETHVTKSLRLAQANIFIDEVRI